MNHLESGNKNQVAFIFSCPGSAEEMADKPAAGNTGRNLEMLLAILSSKDSKQISWTRDDILITNAWDKIEYKKKTNRTQALISEILEPKNLIRLASEIKYIEKLIICCGDRAISAVNALQSNNNQLQIPPSVKIIQIQHLGFQSLNQISKDINNTPIHSVNKEKKKYKNTKTRKEIGRNNTIRRLQVIAQKIMTN